MQQRMMLRTLCCLGSGGLLVLASCRAPSASTPAAPDIPVAYSASSLQSHYALRGSFQGAVTREPGRLVVRVDEALIRSSTSARNLQLRAGLGHRSSRGWEYEPHGPAVALLDSIRPGQELTLETLRLSIPISDRLILDPHWLVFELTARDGARQFSTFVCTRRDIFRAQPSNESIPTGEAYAFWC